MRSESQNSLNTFFYDNVSAISYFSVINAATLSSVHDTASSYTTMICEPTIMTGNCIVHTE